MIIEVKVPSVGESVTSGVVSAWHKKSGEFVNEGEPLFALEPEKITGTGQGGRLTKADVLKAVENRSKAEPSEVAVAKAEEKIEPREVQPPREARFIRKKMSPLRRKIAQQLVMAQHTAAILTTFNECDMSALQELRGKAQEEFTKKNGVKLGLMSFFIKASVEALKAVPAVNGRIEDDDFI